MSDFLKNYDAITDTQLRTCVKLLGKLLGNAIKSHACDLIALPRSFPKSFTQVLNCVSVIAS